MAGGLIRGTTVCVTTAPTLAGWGDAPTLAAGGGGGGAGDGNLITMLLAGKEASLKYMQAWSKAAPRHKSGLQQQKANAIGPISVSRYTAKLRAIGADLGTGH